MHSDALGMRPECTHNAPGTHREPIMHLNVLECNKNNECPSKGPMQFGSNRHKFKSRHLSNQFPMAYIGFSVLRKIMSIDALLTSSGK